MNATSHTGPNGHRPLFDAERERSLLAALMHDPSSLAEVPELEVRDFGDLRARAAFAAMRNLQAAGEGVSLVGLVARLEVEHGRGSSGAEDVRRWLTGAIAGAPPVRELADAVRLDAARRAAAIEADELREREEHEIDDQALRDCEPDEQPELRDSRLCPRLDAFLGTEEPDADDAADWNIRDIVPRGEPFIWAARAKAGKTWGALDLAIAIARGEPSWCGFENTRGAPANVLGVFLEDSKRRLRSRLWELCRARGITPNDEQLREHLSITREPIRLPDDARRLAKALKPWGPVVILVDNLTRTMTGDPNSTRDASAFTKAWLQLGDELGAAIGFLHHTRKASGGEQRQGKAGDPFDTIRGSGDFAAAARHVIVSLPVDGEAPASEVHLRGNLELRADSFVLGFERSVLANGRWQARSVNRGDVAAFRSGLRDQRSATKEAEKRARVSEELERRRTAALRQVRENGACSSRSLGAEIGTSDRTAAQVLAGLASSGVLRFEKARGYVFPDGGAK